MLSAKFQRNITLFSGMKCSSLCACACATAKQHQQTAVRARSYNTVKTANTTANQLLLFFFISNYSNPFILTRTTALHVPPSYPLTISLYLCIQFIQFMACLKHFVVFCCFFTYFINIFFDFKFSASRRSLTLHIEMLLI